MSSFYSQDLKYGWKFRMIEGSSVEQWLPVSSVPSTVHIDLIDNKRLPDPLLDCNEIDCHWVEEKDWSYMCQFPSPSRKSNDKVDLVFEGLDTFASVQLNGIQILASDNMFIQHRVDITEHLHPEKLNILQIDFTSALTRGLDIKKNSNHRFIAHQGADNRMAVRKAQYHWGWDWGPRLLTAGIWRPVRIEVYSGQVSDVSINYTLDESLKTCHGFITMFAEGRENDQISLVLSAPDGNAVFKTCHTIGSSKTIDVPFTLENPALWYPHGYGEQARYTLKCTLSRDDVVIHDTLQVTGFRRAELIQENDNYGKSFYFRVNGIDIFAGGSCWIPADSFTPRIPREKYRQTLSLMIESNQIMTRIWGGGIFEEPIFYDTCDELGILVWQDFMFACGSYPAFPSFLESVEKEARSNVRLLHRHPSVIIYAGGNENYYIQETYKLSYDYNGDKDPQSWLQSSFPSRYIYEYLLPKVVAEESPTSIYHPDSPWGDGKPILDTTVGDIHQWEVWHGIMRPYQEYGDIGGRFNSEFGMEACPHLSTINHFITNPKERYPQSLTMDFHNKASQHERRLASYVFENFGLSKCDLNYWVYLTQLLQAEAMHFAYRSYRRQWGTPSQRACGGALVWQLNDCWPATSWAIVDYFLVRKPAFYTLKRDLSPLSISVIRNHRDWTRGHVDLTQESECDVWVSNSTTSVVKDATVEIRFISIETGQECRPLEYKNVEIIGNGTTTVYQGIKLKGLLDSNRFVVSVKLLVNGVVVSRDCDWPQPYKYYSFEDRGLTVKFNEAHDELYVSSLKPTKGLIFSERPGLEMSDNGFDVLPGEKYVIRVKGFEEGKSLQWTYLGGMTGTVN